MYNEGFCFILKTLQTLQTTPYGLIYFVEIIKYFFIVSLVGVNTVIGIV